MLFLTSHMVCVVKSLVQCLTIWAGPRVRPDACCLSRCACPPVVARCAPMSSPPTELLSEDVTPAQVAERCAGRNRQHHAGSTGVSDPGSPIAGQNLDVGDCSPRKPSRFSRPHHGPPVMGARLPALQDMGTPWAFSGAIRIRSIDRLAPPPTFRDRGRNVKGKKRRILSLQRIPVLHARKVERVEGDWPHCRVEDSPPQALLARRWKNEMPLQSGDRSCHGRPALTKPIW
ncbi:hypothetical protein B0J18DRAFT_416189 [Chaetomium sp. MPI-SDFR-AT-0129]|nr:hypothetical protein B0J18DRAFT_416189 [Chaetomium sp. MPI-SDFR-AT-0129]